MTRRFLRLSLISAVALLPCVSPACALIAQPAETCSVERSDPWEISQPDAILAAGAQAARDGKYANADSLFRRATRSETTAAEAWYLRARLAMLDEIDDPASASRYLRQALDLEPGNIRFIEERLNQVNSGKSYFMGSDADTKFWADRIFSEDPRNAIAHAKLGRDFLTQYNNYRIRMMSNANDVLAKMMEDALESARTHLESAIQIDPCLRGAYSDLIRLHFTVKQFDLAADVAAYMEEHFADDPISWLYGGAAAYYSGRADEAEDLFEHGLRLMSDSERKDYAQEDYFFDPELRAALSDDSDIVDAYWKARRPRYLTDENERLLSHYARLVYADLFYPYWRKFSSYESQYTPGEFVVRWGLPRSESRFTSGLSRSLTVRWPNESITFTDFTRNGEYFIIDPSMFPDGMGTEDEAALLPASVIVAAHDRIHAAPESFVHVGSERVTDVPYLVSVLKSQPGPEKPGETRPSRGDADILISLGIPLAPSDSNRAVFGRALDADNADALSQLFLTLGSFVVTPAGDIEAEKRQTFYGLPPQGVTATPGGTLWTTTHHHTALPGDYRISVEFETLARDVMGATPSQIHVPRFDADSLQLSDLVMAYSIEEATPGAPVASNHLSRSRLDIVPAPWAVYSTEQPIYIYFEMYNLERSPTGSTDVEIQVGLVPSDAPEGIAGFFNRLFGGEEEGVAVTSSYVGSSKDDGQYVIVDASGQTPGEYELVVRVRDLDAGAVTESRRTVILEKAATPSGR